MQFAKCPKDVEVLTFALAYLAGRGGIRPDAGYPFKVPDEELPEWLKISWDRGLEHGLKVTAGQMQPGEWEDESDKYTILMIQAEKLGPVETATILAKQIYSQKYEPPAEQQKQLESFINRCEKLHQLSVDDTNSNTIVRVFKVSSQQELKKVLDNVLKDIVKEISNEPKKPNQMN
jgi:hypothetical protein